METRKNETGKFSELPVDFLNMVNEIFTSNFDPGLQALEKLTEARPYFQSIGRIYANEIVLCVSLMQEGVLAATSVYASCDFDPKASSPTAEDLLNACVDATGAIFGNLLNPENPDGIEQIADESLGAMKNIPFEWTQVEIERHRIYLKVDKANPELDQLTDDWLAKNDPHHKEAAKDEEEEVKKLFVTGEEAKKKIGGQGGNGTVH
jgi:hypothetical protein